MLHEVRRLRRHVTTVSQKRLNYAEKKVMGVKIQKLKIGLTTRESGLFRWWSWPGSNWRPFECYL